jgi:hypothetical protein
MGDDDAPPRLQLADLAVRLSGPVLIFYLLVVTNFTGSLLGCRLQNSLATKVAYQHIVGFMVALFFVANIDKVSGAKDLVRVFGAAAGVYLWFQVTARCPVTVVIGVLVLLFVVYIIDNIEKQKSAVVMDALLKRGDAEPPPSSSSSSSFDRTASKLQTAKRWIAAVAILASVGGFCVYAYEKKREYGEDFRFYTFIMGTAECRRFTPASAITIE